MKAYKTYECSNEFRITNPYKRREEDKQEIALSGSEKRRLRRKNK